MERTLKNGKKVIIYEYDDQVFKLLFRTFKDFKIYNECKKHGINYIKERCYTSRLLHINSESVFKNYIFWPDDFGIQNIKLLNNAFMRNFFLLVFSVRIINNFMTDKKIKSRPRLYSRFFDTFFPHLTCFTYGYETLKEEYNRFGIDIDLRSFIDEINNSIKIIINNYKSYYRSYLGTVDVYYNLLKNEYGIER